MKKKQPFLLGAHMSIAGGLEKSITQSELIGGTCMQIFTKSNRQWQAKQLTDLDSDLFKKTTKQSVVVSTVMAHASYLINLGASNPEINKKSVEAFDIELKRCEKLEIPYLVLHPGSCGTFTQEECISVIATKLNEILEKNPGKTMVLLENMAGQGSAVGSTVEQFASIYKKIDHKNRIGFCFDTCHAFAAGYDFRDHKSYSVLWEQFDAIIGLDKLKAFHINDSKKELGSHIDRHEHIGKGKIGLEAFKLLFNDPKFFEIPKVLETPKEKDLEDDIKNIATIKDLLTEKTKAILQVI